MNIILKSKLLKELWLGAHISESLHFNFVLENSSDFYARWRTNGSLKCTHEWFKFRLIIAYKRYLLHISKASQATSLKTFLTKYFFFQNTDSTRINRPGYNIRHGRLERVDFPQKNAWVWHLFFWEAHTHRYSKKAKWKNSMCGLARNIDVSVLGYVVKRWKMPLFNQRFRTEKVL